MPDKQHVGKRKQHFKKLLEKLHYCKHHNIDTGNKYKEKTEYVTLHKCCKCPRDFKYDTCYVKRSEYMIMKMQHVTSVLLHDKFKIIVT